MTDQHGDGGSQTADVSLFTSDETDEWATPPEFLRPLADAVGGFDLDAASGAETSPIAEHAYTEEDDGLAQPWFGTVWCNPPYSEMAAWTDKVVSELQRDEVDAILYLCKGDTSTDWWHQALAEATAVGMLDTRLSFGDGSESAPFASHVFVFGDVPGAVLDALDREGAVFDAADKHERSEQRKLVTDGGVDQGTEGVAHSPSSDLPTIEYETDSGHRRRVSYERAEETARVVRREYRLLDDGWVAAGAEELRSLEIDGEPRMPVTLRTKLVSND